MALNEYPFTVEIGPKGWWAGDINCVLELTHDGSDDVPYLVVEQGKKTKRIEVSQWSDDPFVRFVFGSVFEELARPVTQEQIAAKRNEIKLAMRHDADAAKFSAWFGAGA